MENWTPALILDKVRSVIATQLACEVENILPEHTFEKLGADSVNEVEILVALEEELGILLEDGDVAHSVTVQELADTITQDIKNQWRVS